MGANGIDIVYYIQLLTLLRTVTLVVLLQNGVAVARTQFEFRTYSIEVELVLFCWEEGCKFTRVARVK